MICTDDYVSIQGSVLCSQGIYVYILHNTLIETCATKQIKGHKCSNFADDGLEKIPSFMVVMAQKHANVFPQDV